MNFDKFVLMLLNKHLKGGEVMYNSQEIAENIKKEANNKKIKLGTMWNDIDVTNNTLHNMKRSYPSIETLAKIADYLDCSIDDLIGRKPRTKKGKKNNARNVLDERTSVLLEKIKRLPPDAANQFENLLDTLLAALPPIDK